MKLLIIHSRQIVIQSRISKNL